MDYEDVVERVVVVVEAVGIATMVVGGVVAFVAAAPDLIRAGARQRGYETMRRTLGRAILLGVEFLIVGDIIRTVVVERTVEALIALGAVVLIRIILSWSLEVELDGTWPWRRDEPSRRQTAETSGSDATPGPGASDRRPAPDR
ncbi:MAG: DUF1622 domain-containing protein [Acidimicrobiales bacterium]